jgi:hypothetical protein
LPPPSVVAGGEVIPLRRVYPAVDASAIERE